MIWRRPNPIEVIQTEPQICKKCKKKTFMGGGKCAICVMRSEKPKKKRVGIFFISPSLSPAHNFYFNYAIFCPQVKKPQTKGVKRKRSSKAQPNVPDEKEEEVLEIPTKERKKRRLMAIGLARFYGEEDAENACADTGM